MTTETTTGLNTDILIIEDDKVAATLLKKALTDLGHTVVGIEADGEKAIELAKEKRPGLLMVDYNLDGDLNGVDVTRSLQKEQSTAVVYVTSKSDEATLNEIANTSPYGYILKPFNTQEVRMVISTALEKLEKERALKSANQELDEQVNMTRAELEKSLVQLKNEVMLRKRAQIQLEIALKNEKELSQIKSRIATSISNEFTNPITSILSSIQILQLKNAEADVDKSYEKHLNRIEGSVFHIKSIISNLLLIEKSGLDNNENKESRVTLDKFMNSIVSDLQEQGYEDRNIQIELPDSPKSIITFESLLKQIIFNLASNACKYSAEDSTIKIEVLREDSALRFDVIDQGIGIPEGDQEHLFDYFFRATNVGKIEGNGLGLAVIKNFATIMDAKLTFKSTEGVGSTFSFSLPMN